MGRTSSTTGRRSTGACRRSLAVRRADDEQHVEHSLAQAGRISMTLGWSEVWSPSIASSARPITASGGRVGGRRQRIDSASSDGVDCAGSGTNSCAVAQSSATAARPSRRPDCHGVGWRISTTAVSGYHLGLRRRFDGGSGYAYPLRLPSPRRFPASQHRAPPRFQADAVNVDHGRRPRRRLRRPADRFFATTA